MEVDADMELEGSHSEGPVPTEFLISAPAPEESSSMDGTATSMDADAAAGTSSSRFSDPVAHSILVDDHPCTPPGATTAGGAGAVLRRLLALAGAKRNNILALDDEYLLIGAGSACELLHLPSGEQRCLPARPGAGVACLARHPSGRYFAVGERRAAGAPSM